MAKKKTKAYSEAFRKQTEKSAHHDISRLFWRFWSNHSEIISCLSGDVMKKKMFVVSIIAVMISFGVSTTHARPDQRYDAGTQKTRDLTLKNRRAGYKIFRNFCKSCHYRENEKAPFLHTESKSMRGWNAVFHKKRPKCAKQGLWDKLTSDDLLNLNDYLYYNARDAYDPYDPWDNDGFRLYH